MLYSYTRMPCLALLKQVWLHPPLDVRSHTCSPLGQSTEIKTDPTR